MKKETKVKTPKTTKVKTPKTTDVKTNDILELNPEVFIPKRNVDTLDSNGDPILLDGQAASLLNEKSLLETDAKSDFKINMEVLSKTLARKAASKDGLTLSEIYPLRKQYLAYRMRIEKGTNCSTWVLRSAAMCFDAVISKALYRIAINLTNNQALIWDYQLNKLNQEYEVMLKPQIKERGQFLPCNMVDLSEPEIDTEDEGIFAEPYPEGTEDCWLMRS